MPGPFVITSAFCVILTLAAPPPSPPCPCRASLVALRAARGLPRRVPRSSTRCLREGCSLGERAGAAFLLLARSSTGSIGTRGAQPHAGVPHPRQVSLRRFFLRSLEAGTSAIPRGLRHRRTPDGSRVFFSLTLRWLLGARGRERTFEARCHPRLGSSRIVSIAGCSRSAAAKSLRF